MIRHIKNILIGFWRLLQGMYITFLNMVRPKVTEQYPENRGKKVYPENFRAQLTMPHDAQNHHKCTACGICMMNCPNGTINVISRMQTDEATGRQVKVLDRYMYDLGSCIFCSLCVQSCPQNAIGWSNEFEHSVFDKSKLVQRLNREGSSLLPKPAPVSATGVKSAPATPADAKPTPSAEIEPKVDLTSNIG